MTATEIKKDIDQKKTVKFSLLDKSIWILSSTMLAVFFICETASYGKYIMLGISIVVLLLTAWKNSGKFVTRLEFFHYWIMAFSFFCFVSAIWAVSSTDAISKAVTIFEILICMSCFYPYYRDYGGIDKLLKTIMWAGYIVMAYTIMYFGVSEIIRLLSDSQRLASSFSNSNSLGMMMMYSLIITIYYWLFEGFKLVRLIAIPEIVLIAVTGSRKALVGTAIGVILIYIYKLLSGKNFKSFLKAIMFLVAVIAVLYILAEKNVFTMVSHRMESIWNEFLNDGSGYVDNSTLMREKMKKLGLSLFQSHPIVGIGIGSPYIYSGEQLGFEAYLHDNYVELLAGGGIIGFAIYYGFHFYVAKNLLKYKFFKDSDMTLVMIILLIILIMDYGAVSYYSKSTYVFRMLLSLSVLEIRRRRINAN